MLRLNPNLQIPPNHPLQVHGSLSSHRALTIFNHLLDNPVLSTLVICSNNSQVNLVYQDFETFRKTLDPSFRILRYPTWDHSPYHSITPSLKVRFGRTSALHETLTESSQPIVLICSVQAYVQRVVPRAIFKKYQISLKIDHSIESRQLLHRKLLQAGFQQTDQVEDPGTFSIRGEIIDLFPSSESHPVRIELFDDVVEKIRYFHPETQRTLPQSDLKNINFSPAREVLIHDELGERLCRGIKSFADENDISRKIRDPVLESIRYGHYPDQSDYWVPFLYENETISDYFQPDQTLTILFDRWSVQKSLDRSQENNQALFEESRKKGILLPSPELLFKKDFPAVNISFESLEETSLETNHSQDKIYFKLKENLELKKEIDSTKKEIQVWIQEGYQVYIFSHSESRLERLKFLFQKINPITYKTGELSQGFRWPEKKIAILTDAEILGKKERIQKNGGSTPKDWSGVQNLSDLEIGDTVVHVQHGLGKYLGMTRLKALGTENDFIQIQYADQDRLYLPVYRLDQIQKYIGGKENVRLHRLGAQSFEKTKQKVKKSIKTLAIDLIKIYAKRKIEKGISIHPDSEAYREFEDHFPYNETPDQRDAISEVTKDLQSGRTMDRIVCGDVGFGKTEVAMRAAFQTVYDGYQVVVLVPTTVLALQHTQSFQERFSSYPINIECLSRFQRPKAQKQAIERAKKGELDILIGTHRVLSKDVQFRKLGLVIVDEEHRFGVEHKEKLKTLQLNTHLLTLTATPIPRTLQMCLTGLREISLIRTPPVNRLPIRTYISKREKDLIKKAIEFELERGGQVFFLHNRVQSIHKVAEEIQQLVPAAKIQVAHGQMSETQLEKAMIAFYQKEKDILVCTTIIESGLDIPLANTILIDRADTFGLAQLYQLRGRVGRSEQRAFCYLLISASGRMTDDAKKRLEVIQRFVELGSGFNIASYDLEIRGGGNVLGPEQSGNIAAVGFELYTRLLEEAIHEIKGEEISSPHPQIQPEIKTPFSAFIGEEYIPDSHQRLKFYRKLSATQTEKDVSEIELELLDRFGKIPSETNELLWLIRLKQLLVTGGITHLTTGKSKVSLKMDPKFGAKTAEKLISLAQTKNSQVKLIPDCKAVIHTCAKSIKDLFFELSELLA